MGPLLAALDKVVHNRAQIRDTVSFIACPTAGGGVSRPNSMSPETAPEQDKPEPFALDLSDDTPLPVICDLSEDGMCEAC